MDDSNDQRSAAAQTRADTVTRRSVSIFSRRGTESLDASDGAVRGFTFAHSRQVRTAFRARASRGTRLDAIPQVDTQRTVSASPLATTCETASQKAPTLDEIHGNDFERRRSESISSHSQSERIGVWVDGIVHWEGVQQVSNSRHVRSVSDESGCRLKPSLTVVIPHGRLLTPAQNAAALERPATRDGSSHLRTRSSPARQDVEQNKLHIEKSKTAATTSPQRRNPSRSSSTSSAIRDDISSTSKHSSNTSVDAQLLKRLQSVRDKILASADFSTVDTKAISTTEELTPVTQSYVDKPLPPTPPPNIPATPSMPRRPKTARSVRSTRSPHPVMVQKAKSLQSSRSSKHKKSMSKLDQFDLAFMNTSPYAAQEELADSPTLSQAETDLHEHLGRMSQHIDTLSTKNRQLQNTGLGISNVKLPIRSQVANAKDEKISDVPLLPSRAPTLPRKSRKRDWQHSAVAEGIEAKPVRRLSDPSNLLSPAGHDAPSEHWWMAHRLSRSVSSASLTRLHGYAEFIVRDHKELVRPPPVIDDGLIVVAGPLIVQSKRVAHIARATSQKTAKTVLIKILASLNSIDDLTNALYINKGMYEVYRENEQSLVLQVAQNESPPACELREWLRPSLRSHSSWYEDADESSEELSTNRSAHAYIKAWKRDAEVIASLKKIILRDCQGFIRKETVAAMIDNTHARAQQVTDAFWRIWTFCTVFGSEKGRDEDLVGQLDWLKGGRLANNLDCGATVNTNFDFDVSSILLNAPEHFGRGNGEGLTADQLYDITEIWTCLATLLQGYLGRLDQARDHGIYDNCQLNEEDIEAEEYMLEEWIAFVLTLGPEVVLQLAEHAQDLSSTGFALAQAHGWTKWSPPVHTTSRATFLKESVARLYEDRVTTANAKARNAHEQEEKESARKRIAAHALEIRIRRQDSAFKRVPLVDMSMERPMSIMSTLSGGPNLTPRFPPRTITLPVHLPPVEVHPALRAERAPLSGATGTVREAMHSPATPSRPIPSISITQHSVRNSHREALRTFNGVGIGTVELAIERIVAMGFTEVEAKHALRTTDSGDGLRVDRAVEYLGRQRGVKW